MTGPQSTIVQQMDLAFNGGVIAGLGDAELLERFLVRHGPAAEAAFAALVRRHGPMVHRVCRAILRDHHEAQDAAQATFLVLARKAGSLRVETSLGPWLHGVACRVAARARAAAARRRACEARAAGMTPILVAEDPCDDVGPILHEEIARLPDRYRAPVILCDLEGRTYEEVARALGRPVGTIKSRLARGRGHLRGRMIRRGIAPAALASAELLADRSARAAPWAASIEATSRLAVQLAEGRAAAGLVPTSVLILMEGAINVMSLSRLKLAVATLLVACGALSVPVISGQLAPGEPGRIAGSEPPPHGSASPNRPRTPAPAPEPDARLDQILEEWQRRSAARASLDVRFTLQEIDRKWHEQKSGTGRIVLTSGGQMRAELDRGTRGVPDQQRILWGEDENHQFDSISKTHTIWPIAATDRGRIPALVALPFCWKLGVDGLRSRFRVELAGEKPPGICALRFTPQTPLGRQSFSKALVILDLSTYLPARYVMISPDGNSTRDYRVTEIRCDRPVPDELWRIPDDQGWQVVRHGADRALDRWLVRLIKIDLVP